ncbi:unnamed protein product [Absidia cylindrospora]
MEEQLEKKRHQTAQIRTKTQETMNMLEQYGLTISSSSSSPSSSQSFVPPQPSETNQQTEAMDVDEAVQVDNIV